ncbi:MAG TPA: ACP synthase [Polyangia bacterium]
MNLANPTTEHIGELALRRRRAGEALGADTAAIDAHAAACPDCRARIRALDEEQRRFEQEISFDRFAAGVERAARGASKAQAAKRRPILLHTWVAPMLAAAACLVAVVTFAPRPVINKPTVRSKGGAGINVRVAGVDGQRNARGDSPEPLVRGERLRIGYQSGGHRYLIALTIDDHGVVQALSPEQGQSLALGDGSEKATRYLPGSWELDGAGVEQIIVVMSDQAIDVAAAMRAARAAYDKVGGNLARMPSLDLPGEQFVRTFAKP